MIDVNKITSTLAKLPDQQLQQYAQMHKNDPYIMALAMSESNRRKEMRAAGQGAQGMQEQPKVVDQMVAGMAPQPMPEDQGIARIPAGEMNFAGGGIVAFADGGDVERYSGDFGSLTGEFSGFGGMSPEQAATAELRTAQEAKLKQLSDLEQKTAFLKSAGAPQAQAAQAQLDALKASMQPKPSPTDPNFRRQQDPRIRETGAVPVVPAAQPLITSGAAPKADTTQRSLSGGPKVTSTAAATPAAGLDALDPNKLFATAMADAKKTEGPEKGMLEALNAERKTAAESELSGVKALNEKFADAFKGRRERLDTREGAIGKMKDQNFGLALLQAGAAMMSTPGNLGTAIGKGVQTGSQQYVAGIDKINSAKDKLADARDRLDDLQLNRDEMSAREILKAENKIRDTALSGQENMIKFVMERDKVNRETAMKVVDNQIKLGVTQAEIFSKERISANETGAANARSAAQIAATLNTPDRILFDQLLKKNSNDAVKALEEFKLAKGDKFDVRSSYADFIKEAAKSGLAPESLATYAGRFGATLPR